MTKKKFKKRIVDNIGYELDGETLDSAIILFQEYVEQFGGNSLIEIVDNYENSYLILSKLLEETDSEYESRLSQEKKRKDRVEESERKRLAELKAKYECP